MLYPSRADCSGEDWGWWETAVAAEWAGRFRCDGQKWKQRKLFGWVEGLRTSLNSTLLWKLQLPLSRLALQLHPLHFSSAWPAQTSTTGLHPVLIPGRFNRVLHAPRHNQTIILQVRVCVCWCAFWSAKPYTCTKRYPKNIWWRRKPMRDKTLTCFYLFIVGINLSLLRGRTGRRTGEGVFGDGARLTALGEWTGRETETEVTL